MDKKNPWGKRPTGSTLEDRLKEWQRKLESLLGGGGGDDKDGRSANPSGGNRLLFIIIAIAFLIWIGTGFYIVDAAQRGVILRFGRYMTTTNEGLHWHLPRPIESHDIVDVARNESIEDKTRMLTSDENLVDITIAVQYLRAEPRQFLFNVRKPEETLRDVSESAIREIVGQSSLESVLGAGRQGITERTKVLIQRTLDNYKTGIHIITVNLTAVNVPDQVAPSQKDAIKAREDRDRYSQEAEAYANDILPRSRGTAAKQSQDAQAYRAQVIAGAEGETSRFSQLQAAYARAPKVTRERLYLETVEKVLSGSRKVVLDTKPGSSNMVYLPLDALLNGAGKAGTPPATTAPRVPAETESVVIDGRARGER